MKLTVKRIVRVASVALGFVLIVLIVWAAKIIVPLSRSTATVFVEKPFASITKTPFQPVLLTPTQKVVTKSEIPADTKQNNEKLPSQTPSPSLIPGLWVSPYVPKELVESITIPAGYRIVENEQDAQLRLQIGDDAPISTWIYALVAPYFTITDTVSAQDLINSWKGASTSFVSSPLLVDEQTLGAFTVMWGEPSNGSVQVVPTDKVLETAWNQRSLWAIVPFENLEPRWKVLEVDGISPLRKEFDPDKYTLSIRFSLAGNPELIKDVLERSEVDDDGVISTNRDASKITIIAMTGVTAMVRCTAFTMERKGNTYPAQDIRDWLREADVAHISNEIPFFQDCPPPNCTQPDLRFCSNPDYMALLEDVGTDIVELTGDHFADYGPDPMRYTLQLYRDMGWIYYGGGENRDDARQARTFEHNGNRIAFIGCNAKGGGYATASDTNPGAVACDFEWMHSEITRLSREGYLVIATFQHIEYYSYNPQPQQIEDYRGMAEAGAVIVSGSQAHQPQGIEFFNQSFIHYGLGNLFFDQYNQPVCPNIACNDAFVDRHVFYDGRYLGTDLLTMTFVDFAKPRPMTSDERAILLNKVFSASGW